MSMATIQPIAGVGCGEFSNRTNRERCGTRCLPHPTCLVKISGIPGADGETSIHSNPGPDVTDFRAEHGPDHIHFGDNAGPRVKTEDFTPFSEEDARRMTRKQKQFCEKISEESKNLIRSRQRQIFQYGRVLLQLQAGGLLSISAACRADPGWCLDQIDAGVLP